MVEDAAELRVVGWGQKTIISHEEVTVTIVEHPTHGLGESVRRVDFAAYVNEDKFSQFTPLLKAKIANGDMARSCCRPIMVDDLEDGFVIFPDRGWSSGWKTKIC